MKITNFQPLNKIEVVSNKIKFVFGCNKCTTIVGFNIIVVKCARFAYNNLKQSIN